jgi:hypothetical protein
MKDKCRVCGANILWVVTASNQAIPVNAKPDKRFILVRKGGYHEARVIDSYVIHYVTCPKSAEYTLQ